MQSTTGSQHSFAQVPHANIQRSSFNRSSGWKGTLDSGWLVPFFADEVLPGDTFNHNSVVFGRMATPIYPIFDNLFCDSHFFFVPNRLIFENWQKMMGEQENPNDSTDYILPTSNPPVGGYQPQTLQDYFGLPTQVDNFEHNTLHMRAYNLIYNEWFRDQNLQDSVPFDKGDGPDDPADYVLLRRGKRHDYFTSALPWPQKGDPVTIPIGASDAPVIGNPNLYGGRLFTSETSTGGTQGVDLGNNTQISNQSQAQFVTDAGGIFGAAGIVSSNLVADLSSANAATINQLRTAFQIQKMFEKDARGGSRYTEIVRQHFGVVSPDARLQRPEYLGGGSTPINIDPVKSKTDTDSLAGGRPLGDLAATGTVVSMRNGFTKSFTEHGVIIGLISVRADLNYQQGLNRMFSRSDRFDFYFPSLAHLGEQEVLNKEIYCDGTPPDDEVFGYQERYAEYRYKPSVVTGLFRSNVTDGLDTWHLCQEFENRPTLSAQFIEENPPVDRVIATPDEPQFIFDTFHKTICARPMPLYGVPGNIDRF